MTSLSILHSTSDSHFFRIRKIYFCLLFLFFFTDLQAQTPADPSSIIGKIVCGYQGWFTCTGDGSPINRWTHWSPTTAPKAGVAPNPNPNLTFDLYPDVSLYDNNSLFATNFANQGDGNAAKLFSSYKEDVMDTHFKLMEKHAIDGVAFQRFIWEVLVDPAFKANRDTIAARVKRKAEKYNRIFYLVYDLSGIGNVPNLTDAEKYNAIKTDWLNTMNGALNITSSPMYTKQNGKPVVQIWGVGYNHIPGTAAQQKDLIDWFKAQGCYVIAGVPTGWRTGTGASKTGFINTYKSANMISPWSVGAYDNLTSANTFKTDYLATDLTFCQSNNLAYQPVIFPGFSWYNWNGGVKNQISRNKGEFLWRQATNLQSLGIKTAEIAMFDEYDEGTAILNMADGYDMIPTNQYFVTSSADGTYISSDFYLRLANKISLMLKNVESVTTNVAIPYSVGPIFFRTSMETGIDATPTWTSNSILKTNISANGTNTGNPTCVVVNSSNSRRGSYALQVRGRDLNATNSNVYFQVFDVNIPVNNYSTLHYYIKPINELGKYVSVDLLLTDGTYLRNTAAVDTNGVSMHPSTAKGTVNAYSKITCKIGKWLHGKTIDKILVGYDHGAETGDFEAVIDDISIVESYSVLPVTFLDFTVTQQQENASLKWATSSEINLLQYSIEKSFNGIDFSKIGTVYPSYSGAASQYVFIDKDYNSLNKSSVIYYRIAGIDKDGKITRSFIRVLENKINPFFVENIYPNPFDEFIQLQMSVSKDTKVNLILHDVIGKTIIQNTQLVKKGNQQVKLKDVKNLKTGIYFLTISSENHSQIFKLTKK